MRDDAPGAAPVRVHEVVRMPTDLVHAAARDSIRHPLVYSMTRERTLPLPPRYDPELTLDRVFEVPAERSFGASGTVRLNAAVADSRLDALLGIPGVAAGGVTADSSARLPGDIGARASAAIDGDPTTAWQTPFVSPAGQSISLQLPAPVTVDHLDLTVFADGRHSTPARLRIASDDGTVREVDVPPVPDSTAENATATVPVAVEPLTGRDLEVTVEAVHPKQVVDYFTGNEVTAPVAIAELGIPGVRRAPEPVELDPACRTGLVSVDGEDVAVRLVGTTAAAERRDGTPFVLCDAGLRLGAGRHDLHTSEGGRGGIDVDTIELVSAVGGAPATIADVAAGSPNAGTAGRAIAPKVEVTANGRDPRDRARHRGRRPVLVRARPERQRRLAGHGRREGPRGVDAGRRLRERVAGPARCIGRPDHRVGALGAAARRRHRARDLGGRRARRARDRGLDVDPGPAAAARPAPRTVTP